MAESVEFHGSANNQLQEDEEDPPSPICDRGSYRGRQVLRQARARRARPPNRRRDGEGCRGGCGARERLGGQLRLDAAHRVRGVMTRHAGRRRATRGDVNDLD